MKTITMNTSTPTTSNPATIHTQEGMPAASGLSRLSQCCRTQTSDAAQHSAEHVSCVGSEGAQQATYASQQLSAAQSPRGVASATDDRLAKTATTRTNEIAPLLCMLPLAGPRIKTLLESTDNAHSRHPSRGRAAEYLPVRK